MKPQAAAEIARFLKASTQELWLDRAAEDWQTLLLDHVECEKKAAASAISLMHRYGERSNLVKMAARLAREELRHVEQADALRRQLAVPWRRLTAGRYAAELRRWLRQSEPSRLLDSLLIAALIEARSCERFEKLRQVLPSGPMRDLYGRLVDSESRHFLGYWQQALEVGVAPAVVISRHEELAIAEAQLILREDDCFRFHSGVPTDSAKHCGV